MKRQMVLFILGFMAATVFAVPQARDDEAYYARKRRDMVASQLLSRDITDKKVIAAMRDIPRHLFVNPSVRDAAYEDYPLPTEEGQTISQPYIVALMTQCIQLKGTEKVLEIGTGSGYQAAVLARLAEKVYSIEISPALAKKASETLSRLGFANVRVRSGDGFFGWPEEAPFEAIIVTCAPGKIPEPLFEQLAEGGRLIIPVGEDGETQTLTLLRKIKGKPVTKDITFVRFVPMTGAVKKK